MRPDQPASAAHAPMDGHRERRGLTKPEWVFLAALLVFGLSAIGPTWVALHHRRQRQMAAHDIRALERAILRFKREYGTWPAPPAARSVDIHYGRQQPNAELMRILRAEPGPGNPDHALNPQRMMFVEIAAHTPGWSGLDARGEFMDPWGTPYQIVLDSNYDNAAQVENSIYGRLIGSGVMIWSCGPDRKSDTKDDLISWRPG